MIDMEEDTLTDRGKRGASPSPEESSTKRRVVAFHTFKKWRTDNDKDYQTISWLDCERSGDKVTHLKCTVCTKYRSVIEGARNYSDKWIVGADSLRTSNIRDHAKTSMHKLAVLNLKKDNARSQGLGPTAYAPIARFLNELPQNAMDKLRKKFGLAYFIATEKLAFSKYPALCDLAKTLGVDIGTEYTNEHSAKTFLSL